MDDATRRLLRFSPFPPRRFQQSGQSDRHRGFGKDSVDFASDDFAYGVGVFDQVKVEQPLETIRRHSLVSSPLH